MARKSVTAVEMEAQGLVPAVTARITPPAYLDEAQCVVWHEIVNSLPADYFSAADVQMLAAFCVAGAMHKEATQLVREHGMLMYDAKGRAYANPVTNVIAMQASSMASMSVKLRMCPSARITQAEATTKSKSAGGASRGKKPWEDSRDVPDPDDQPMAPSKASRMN